MGWKTINGRRCYYRSEREEGRVKTTYCVAGDCSPGDPPDNPAIRADTLGVVLRNTR
jgi:hypothetical protein